MSTAVAAEPAALVASSGRQICFCSPHLLPTGQVAEVDLELPPVGRPSRTQVRVTASRAVSGGLYLHQAEINGSFPTYALEHPLLRGPQRFHCRVRVMSPRLPGFRGVTLDFNATGLQLETEGRLEVGQVLPLTIEFDVEGYAPQAVQARVAWCAERGRSRFHCGLSFVSLDERARRRVSQFASYLAGELPLHQLCPDVLRARPLRGRLEAVCVEAAITVRVGGVTLVFPEAQMVRAETGGEVVALRELRSSAQLVGLQGYHHYQFLSGTGEVLAEVVSGALRP